MGIRSTVKRITNPNPIKEWPCESISEMMGCDRGTPIDRYYIEKFLNDNSIYIRGTVAEIGEDVYSRKYGKNVINSMIFTADETSKGNNVIVGDLQTGMGCKEESLDCFILTQTLPFIYDVKNAVVNVMKMLKPGGVVLATVGGVSSISLYDYTRWGHYWGFTKESLEKIFNDTNMVDSIEIQSYGNSKTASAFIYGLVQEELKKEDFEYNDEKIPVTIGIIVKKND